MVLYIPVLHSLLKTKRSTSQVISNKVLQVKAVQLEILDGNSLFNLEKSKTLSIGYLKLDPTSVKLMVSMLMVLTILLVTRTFGGLRIGIGVKI